MTQQRQMAEQLFAGNSEMARLMRSYDWSQTSLGSPERWPQSLKTAVRIVLTSRQPMFVWWGDELINLYNDAYKAIVGGKHPEALGQPASVVWQEIWDQAGPRAESAILKNEGTYDEALLLIMERNGYPEETYYTFSYSPTPNDEGEAGGIICANTDDTQRIIGERQLALLRDLAAKTADARTFNDACTLSARCLETNLYDLPFAIIYLVDPDQQHASLAATSGIDRHHAAVPETVDLTADAVWSLATVVETYQVCLVSDLKTSFGHLPTGAWTQPPHQAIAVPIAPSGQTGKAGILVAGLNPFRLFDDTYSGFIDLIAAQISASIANAQAYEEERKRAEALAELDRAKTTFFSNVSHEFRTPLTLMLSPLEELSQTLHERLQPDEREQLELVQRNGLRLQKLVNTLLDFSRIEAGRVRASYEPTDLATYTAELASIFRSLIEQAGMSLAIDCPTLPEPVYVDRDMWEKIVLNLLSNAFKFTFTGSITVRLQAVGDTVALSVRDTGVGIPEAELPRLFERFHRVSDTRSRTYEGSGIGLALVQELVKLHGGSIRVVSQLEQGTTFTIALPFGSAHLPGECIGSICTLPSTATGATPYIEEALRWLPVASSSVISDTVASPQDAALSSELSSEPIIQNSTLSSNAAHLRGSSQRASATQNSKLKTQNFQSARLLLADDNADMRDYLKRLLSQQYTVETVADGVAALAAIRQQMPDLLLTDVMMPGLDGFGLLQSLRADPITQDLPIILLSARAGEEARIEGLEAGADDYLTKPFSARELLARVEATLKLAQLRREAMQQEQALRLEAETAKQQVETILSSINDGFYVLDRNWRFTYVNDRLCEMIAMEREQILGYSLWDLFSDIVDTDLYGQFHRALNEQTPIHTEYFYAAWNRWYNHQLYPSPDGLTVLSTDITDRKQAEAEREQLLISEQAAREQAETANRIKDEFLAVLSHELRSPLNPILGWSKLLRNGKLDAATTMSALETIERNAQLQVQLIDDLLDISRILRGKLTLNITSVDLSFIIAAALETVHLSAETKALQVQTLISPTVGTVNGDAGRLQQVVWNLISNAVKFTPTGGDVIIKLDAIGVNAQIQVIDSGKGISPDFLPYVFEHFRQEDGATTRKFGGLGLGLAIVRQIVEMHGGTVAVASLGEGQGSTFTVHIPLTPRAIALPAARQASEATLDLRGIQILVVDDDLDSRDFIAFVLEHAQANVISVDSGMAALRCIHQARPDIVISDIGMPTMDGYMLMQQIRALEQGMAVLPAIALTAYAGEINQKHALTAGFQAHLSKPVEADKLVATIAHLLKRDANQ